MRSRTRGARRLPSITSLGPAILAAAALAAAGAAPLGAEDSRVLLWADPAVAAAEEAFILAGRDPPLLERPTLSGRLRGELLGLGGSERAAGLADSLAPPGRPYSFDLTTSLYGAWNGSPYRNAFLPQDRFNGTEIFVAGGRALYSTEAMGPALAAPPILDIRLGIYAGPVSLDFNPEFRPATNWYREGDPPKLNWGLLADPKLVDVNFPYRGIATFLSGPVELRMGRDKLHFGPGRTTGLSFNTDMPWADFASARFDAGPLSLSAYFVRLNPYMTDDERYYLDAIYDTPSLNPDNSVGYELIHREAEKNIAICRLTWRLAPWATLALTQHDLVGGRSMQLPDLNPLLLWHNLFQEGVYGVPAMVELSLTPAPGLRLYGQYLLYDAVVADEVGSGTDSAGASAYMAGLTAIAEPFGPGPLADARVRLDAEATLTDPWVYGKHLTLRQFTSRYVLVEPYKGRFWVDYPIGPDFGPDCFDLDLRLGLGRPEGPELALLGAYRVRGSVDLLGYGEGSDYAHKELYHRSGLVFVKDGEAPESRLSLGLEGRADIGAFGGVGLAARGSFRYVWCEGYGFVPGERRSWPEASVALSASYGL